MIHGRIILGTHRIIGNLRYVVMKLHRLFLLLFAVVSLAACATSPEFDTTGIDVSITPQQVVKTIPGKNRQAIQGTTILWGGVIIASTNLKDATQFEILAYPLDKNHRPNTGQQPVGRFLAVQSGYLEAADYTQGRLMTVKGRMIDKRLGRIGEAEYTYPVVNVEQQHLWRKEGDSGEPRIHFGIGVMFHD